MEAPLHSTSCWLDGDCDAPQFAKLAVLRWKTPLSFRLLCRKARNRKQNESRSRAMYSPTLEQFRKLAEQGNLIPVSRRLLADIETPLSAYRKIRGEDESFLFESVEGGEHIGRYSFVGCNPRAVIRQTRDKIEI